MISFAAPPRRDVIRDDAAVGVVDQVRAFEVDEPAREALEARVAEPTGDPRCSISGKVASTFSVSATSSRRTYPRGCGDRES
jgi:hypothetical protein